MLAKRMVWIAVVVILSAHLAYADSGKTTDQLVAEATRVIETVGVFAAKRMIDGRAVLVVDVREKDEYDTGCLPNAVHIPRGLLEFKVPAVIPNKNTTILVYCKKGGRGALSAQTLEVMGYTNVYNLRGGSDAWLAAKLPIMNP